MRVCHCTLPQTNPRACDVCPNNIDKASDKWHEGFFPVRPFISGKMIITEQYDNGVLISRRVELPDESIVMTTDT